VSAIDGRRNGDGRSAGSGQPGKRTQQVVPYGILPRWRPIAGGGRHAWVIDTGIDLTPDLAVGTGANFVLRGKNSVADGNGHGTHVSGTIAALDNAIDVVGVAAGATVHPVRVLDNSVLARSMALSAAWTIFPRMPIPRVAMPLYESRRGGHFQSLHDAIINTANLGIRFAVAAGNDASNAGGYEPAHIDHRMSTRFLPR